MNASTRKILTALQEGPKTTGQLTDLYSARYGARIKDLRDLGYIIESRRLSTPGKRTAQWIYTLIGYQEPAAVVPFPVDSADARELTEPAPEYVPLVQPRPGEVYRSPVFCPGCKFNWPHDPCEPTQLAILDDEAGTVELRAAA